MAEGNGGAIARQAPPYFQVQKGVPAALVRSYKQPLYDSELILSASPAAEFVLFQKPIGQNLNDGPTRKTNLHTNMTNAGQLGTPQSFNVWGFNIRLPKDISLANFRLIEAAGVTSVLFGTDNPFLTVPIEDVPSGVDTEGMGASDSPHIGQGGSDNLYRFDIGGQALHINPTESFSVKISFPSSLAGITGNQLLRFYIRGLLFKGV